MQSLRLTHADLVQRVDTHTTSHNQVHMAVNTTTMTTALLTSLLGQSVQLVTACQTVHLVIAVLSHTQAESWNNKQQLLSSRRKRIKRSWTTFKEFQLSKRGLSDSTSDSILLRVPVL